MIDSFDFSIVERGKNESCIIFLTFIVNKPECYLAVAFVHVTKTFICKKVLEWLTHGSYNGNSLLLAKG